MEFYNATAAKQYARNKTRIIKEINAIEETVADAVDEGLFACDVTNTTMTDTREYAEPDKEAKAHCVMELSTVRLQTDGDSAEESGSSSFISEIDGEYAVQSNPLDEVMCGYAPDFTPDSYANGGRADNTKARKNYFRVGELLVVAGRSDANPLEFKVKEVNSNGEIVDLEIVSRGEFTDEIFDTAALVYKDMDKWLDLSADYGSIGDLRVDRDGNVCYKDVSDIVCDDFTLNIWKTIGTTYSSASLLPDDYGEFADIVVVNSGVMYIKTVDKWVERNKVYNYETFRLPFDYGYEGLYCKNLFGKNWIKTKCGWEEVKHVYNLGDAYRPSPFNYQEGDIVTYNQVFRNTDGTVSKRVAHTLYKCCSKGWREVVATEDWEIVPSNLFGNDYDIFVYPKDKYCVKINGQWLVATDVIRYDSLYLDNNFGKIGDVIAYNGEYNTSSYVKVEGGSDYPNGVWKQVEKVWNFDDYNLGILPVNVDLTWTVKSIILDSKGDGYVYTPTVVFSDGDATATVKVVNDKIVDVVLTNGGEYTDTIPEITFVMIVPSLAKSYYQVWKQTLENAVLQDEMDQVIEYFETTKTYTISRVSNDDGSTFHWHLSWN